jgi:hypothetical protein
LQSSRAQGSAQRSSISFRGATAKILDEKGSHKLKFAAGREARSEGL